MSLLNLPLNVRFFMYKGVADMRCSFNGLTNLVRGELQQSPISGDMFIFFNRRRDQVKLLIFDRDGFLIYHKRLEQGSFEVPVIDDGADSTISAEQLQLILQGIELNSVQHRKRYKLAM